MILSLMKCKICSKVISPPDQALIIGEPPQVWNQRILQSLFSHIHGEMQKEQNRPEKPHTAALVAAITAGENLKGAMLIGNFEIGADQESERQDVLRRVHEITRTVRISEEGLAAMIDEDLPEGGAILNLLCDLRDRYEGLGKYAPAQPAAAPQPEPVKP